MLLTTTLAAGVGAAAAAYGAVSIAIANRFTRARRQAPAQAGPELERSRVHFAARDGRARIDAWYLAAKPRRAAVIFVHGKDSRRGDELKAPTLALAQRFVAAGISVLMIDLRGHGSSSAARLSYGAAERQDVLGAVDWLLERGYDAGRIGVLGASMGASTALLACAEEAAIGALVADSPFADFGVMIERQYRKLSGGLPRCLLPGALAIARLLTGIDLRRVRPIAAAAMLGGLPVLVIHSEGDRFVPIADALAIAAAANAQVWTTASEHHIGSYRSAPDAYAARVTGFFARHLLVRGSCVPVRSTAADHGGAAAPVSRPRVMPLAA